MMQYSWMFVNPKDRYVVLYKDKLSEMDHKVIQYLYQPLIGGLSISLYLTFLNEVTTGMMYSKQTTHRWLMDVLGMPLDDIYQCRRRLEGIGLLKTYKKAAAEGNVFIYEIMPPLTPDAFFHDDLLPIYLQQKLDSRHYERLLSMFSDKKIIRMLLTHLRMYLNQSSRIRRNWLSRKQRPKISSSLKTCRDTALISSSNLTLNYYSRP